jgi:hypothetical protein
MSRLGLLYVLFVLLIGSARRPADWSAMEAFIFKTSPRRDR